jgi:carbamate kinase
LEDAFGRKFVRVASARGFEPTKLEANKRADRVAVFALGGNAIAGKDGNGSHELQLGEVRRICAGILGVLKQGYSLVITHGNGPQVGNLLIQQESAPEIVPPMPLDVCGAMTQGQIGYALSQSLRNMLRESAIEKEVIAVMTQVVVDPDDAAFTNPTKFVGPFFSKEEACALIEDRGWEMKEDLGRGWRRVVPSPRPVEVVEQSAIAKLVAGDCVVIAGGGGGIPVRRDERGSLTGVPAVIDKDFAAQTLANSIGAQLLIFVTPIRRVSLFFGTEQQEDIATMTADEAFAHYQAGHFPPGSMGPKIAAAIHFLRAGGQRVVIASSETLAAGFSGEEGTQIVP